MAARINTHLDNPYQWFTLDEIPEALEALTIRMHGNKARAWMAIRQAMREDVVNQLTKARRYFPWQTKEEFLQRYLEVSPHDLLIP